MRTAARDRLARTLRGDVQTAFSVELTAATEDLSLEVEETLTDPDVRDTWEIPKHLVHAEWDDDALKDVLAAAKEELGLPNAATLTADLHSFLVYQPNQFFLAHQDSEKDDSMVGTLVVTLPSNYAGGELVVGHNEERKTYRGSRAELSLVAFYADCRHEVLRVKSGYRITLTYNLLLHGNNSGPDGDDGTVTELADLLREHFSTPVPRYYGGPATDPDPPNRLVYLLDHEYTPRGLNWRQLKGADASRVALLRTAADKAGCEAVLALADIRTTHGAFPADEGYGYRRRGWYDDYDEDSGGASGSEREYDVKELIDSDVTLTHWTGPDGTRLEETSLHVLGDEVCASTSTGDLTPYSSEYEGYMGNYGNTLDRWYHRATVVVWPRDQAFANRAETSPAWALDELAAMASAGDAPGAQAAAATLAPFWDSTLRRRAPGVESNAAELFGRALRAADAVADAATAAMLLHPFGIEDFTDASVDSFAKIASRYGRQWTAGLLRTWFGAGQGDVVTTLEMSALRAAAKAARKGARGHAGFGDLAADGTARLRARIARPPRASGDWSIELPAGGCTCKLCDTLRVFAEDKSRRTFEWPIAQQSRQHVHSRIDAAELPVTHVTRRQGRPYTLVLNKTDALFAGEQEARTRDEADLEWLEARYNPDA